MRRDFVMTRFACMLAFGGAALVAQGVQTGDLNGVVLSKGKPVVHALVRMEAGRGVRTTTTDDKGAYRFAQNLVGAVRITVTAPGFLGASADAMINLGKTNSVDFNLKELTSTASATVEVVASAGGMDATEVSDGKNSTLDFVNDLPITTRTIQNIAMLTPGTSTDANNGVNIRGAQATQTQYLVDGVDVMDPVTGGAGIFMNEDMIEEVQVVTGGASADLGRFTGGMINTVTKSGTNAFEGVARWELTNPSWNAYNPMDRGANGASTFKNAFATTQNYRFSGPLWLDHLFFVVGYRTISPKQSTSNTTTAPADWGGAQPFYLTLADERKDFKLDYVINNDNRLSWQYNSTKRERTGIDYATQFFGGSTSPATLSSQDDTFSYTALGYVGTLTSDLVLNAHYGHKKEQLGGAGSGGQGGGAPTMVDSNTQYLYDNGIFGHDPDSRPVENATVSLTWFTHGLGDHEIKVGSDWFQSKHNASNSQSPSNEFIYFNGFTQGPGNSPNGDTGLGNRVFDTSGSTYLQVWQPFQGATTQNTIMSYYVNDKWKVNKNLAFNIGLRHDAFKSKNDVQANNFDYSSTTPRLTLIYDFAGDGKWVNELSYDEYSGQVVQGASDNASVVGNPAEYEYAYVAGPGNLRSSYSTTPFLVYNPQAYRASSQIDPNLKMPLTKEIAYTLRHNDGNQGNYSMTVSRRDWINFASNFVSLQPNPVDGNDITLTRIANDASLVRHYFGVEFQWDKRFNEAFSFGGNLTISTLKGNFEGGQSGANGFVNAYGPLGSTATPTVDPGTGVPSGTYQPTRAQLDPYGNLQADRALNANAWGNYRFTVGKDKWNVGIYGTYVSGAPYSLQATDSLTYANPNPAGPTLGYPTASPGAYGSTYQRYFSDRGALRFPDQYTCSVQIGYERPIWEKFIAFGKLNINNLFNHQVQKSWNTSGRALATNPVTKAITADAYNSPGAFWAGGSNYGKGTSSSNYMLARTIDVAFGLRF